MDEERHADVDAVRGGVAVLSEAGSFFPNPDLFAIYQSDLAYDRVLVS